MKHIAVILLLTVLSGSASAQDYLLKRPDPLQPVGENLKVPPGWMIRLDRPDPGIRIASDADSADIFFVSMTPGWHLTTGPSGIFYHPASLAEGTFRLEATIHFFDPQGRNEAYGLFFGGQNLTEADHEYAYFLIRNTGEFLIKQRKGSQTPVIQDWTPDAGIVRFTETSEANVTNKLAVEVGPETVTFYINEKQVAELPGSEIPTDGLTGFRVNHHVNLHISDFRVISVQ